MPADDSSVPSWNIERARRTYNIAHWAGGYFDVSAAGRLVLRNRDAAGGKDVDLYALAAELCEAGFDLPVLVRFHDILRDRLDRLHDAFARAMKEHRYTGRYTAVYPIKVNQQRSVVERILHHGKARVGLEAGSKPELMAVLALGQPGGIVICNGYKDRQYVRLALIGALLGQRVYLVVEKPSELEVILREARALGVQPRLGVRVRLASIGAGKWQNTGGDRAKFGLSAAEVLALVKRLETEGQLDRLQLLHFHMGSQLANLGDIQRGLRESGRYYAELRRLGAALDTVDVGGGLGVDYEGTRSRAFCSMNYSLQEYADTVIHTLQAACDDYRLPHPGLITEAGRAMTAHHAVLITQVLDTERSAGGDTPPAPEESTPAPLAELWRLYRDAAGLAASEIYHQGERALAEVHTQFDTGRLPLMQRAQAESLFFALCRRAMQRIEEAGGRPREVLDELQVRLADKYFCNFSVFQSVPDVWAFDQIFPIMPLHRLDECPDRRAILQDLTCDSDGQIRAYVDGEGVESTLALHAPRPGEPYLLGIFLVGAYQEILGDMHNLFGDTHAVDIECGPDGHRLLEAERGDRIMDLLPYVHFDIESLRAVYRARLEAQDLSSGTVRGLLEELEAGLTGYTYLA